MQGCKHFYIIIFKIERVSYVDKSLREFTLNTLMKRNTVVANPKRKIFQRLAQAYEGIWDQYLLTDLICVTRQIA